MIHSEALIYRLLGANWTLTFSAESLLTLHKHRQKWSWSKEKVGQLYSEDLTGSEVCISFVSVLHSIKASHSGVRFDSAAAEKERAKLFGKGLHCIGFWHSHPEALPSPSNEDEQLAKDHAMAATGLLTGLVFVIVGNRAFPEGIYVGVHDRAKFSVAERVPR
ncbi:MAG: Mov34/MPN/PAD-1 family protein [Betaproteobacteria bacterium]|nr:Mov34/MPN/PAD-1 family protein [Betaproteobacteria bacterium]